MFALQMCLNMMKATLAFCILALTSSYVLLFLLNESVFSSRSPFIVMELLFFMLAFIICVMLLLMLSPSCVDTVFSSSFFLHLLMAVGMESEVIRKVQVLQLAPRCPLDPMLSVFCSICHDPVYGKQE